VGQRGRKKPKRLGEKLLAIRVKLDISQSQLAKLARVPMDVLADDGRELKFPESWKKPKQVTELLERQRRGRIQNRIDILRRQLARSL
jgi:hypothetical protein